MNNFNLSCVLLLILTGWLTSCSNEQIINSASSSSFKVECRKTTEFLNIYSYDKQEDDRRKIIKIERDSKVDMRIINDSILIMAGVRAPDGNIELIINLKNSNFHQTSFLIGSPPLLANTQQIDSIISDDWKCVIYKLCERENELMLWVQSPADVNYNVGPDYVLVLGAHKIDLQNIENGVLKLAITWTNSANTSQPQEFRLSFPDKGLITADRFSVIQ